MIFNVARKELKSMFSSPLGWAILAVLAFVFGWFFTKFVGEYFEIMSGSIRPAERQGVTGYVGSNLFGAAYFIMLFAVPLLSMRLISEERRSQTLPFLFSAPISLTEIVLGKFLGLVAFLGIMIIYLALMMSMLNMWTDLDFGYIISNVFGMFLLLGSFCALGIYFSSLTAHPVVAAILTFIALFVLMMIDRFVADSEGNVLASLSLMQHFKSFSRGLIDTADIVFFVLFIVTFLTLTIRRLDADRLRG